MFKRPIKEQCLLSQWIKTTREVPTFSSVLSLKQKISFKLYLNQIPISKNLKNLIFLKRLKKISFISRGDDYQILFTASPSKSRIINKCAKSLGIKITKIGKICNYSTKSQILDEKLMKIDPKHQGYSHRF